MRVKDLAARLELSFEGDGLWEITSAAALEDAGPSDLSFASGRKALTHAEASGAGCLILPTEVFSSSGRNVLRAENPRYAFAAALSLLYPRPPAVSGIHPSAVIASTADIDPSATIGPHVTIADGARIGAHSTLGSGCYVGHASQIGSHCILHPSVVVYDRVTIGDRVNIHAGAVLGADGFGFVRSGDHYEKFPQIGRVVIEDDVEIGANSCVDRAALGMTLIGHGTKLDNLVHVGHNCQLGKHVVIAAQTGLSGGVVVGDYAVIGGQVGVGDKARIEGGAVIGSKAGILPSKIVKAGEPQWGVPARPLKRYLKTLAYLARLSREQPE